MTLSPGRRFVLAAATVCAIASGCERQKSYRYPPPPPGPAAPAPLAAATASDAPLPVPATAGQVVAFVEGPAIRFRSGPALDAKLVAKEAEALALSPDGQSHVLLVNGQTAKLVTPENPAGFPVDGHASTRAVFSPDGSLALIHTGGFTLLEVATGKTRFEVETSNCAIGFSPDGFLYWHEEAGNWNEWLGSVMRVSLRGGTPERIGPKRFVRQCEASPDGSSFITVFPEPVALVDGKSGRSRVLVDDEQAEVIVSPAADRVCVIQKRGELHDLSCTRAQDGVVEQVLMGGYYPSIAFDPSGRRGLLGSTRENPKTGDIVREVFIADFTTRTVRKLIGFEPKSGSIPTLIWGGRLLTQGSSRGMMVYDVDRGEKRFIGKARLYGAEPMRGHERRFFADAETFGGQDNAELYDVVWP